MMLDSLDDLFVNELQDLYSAETQLVGALPAMAAAASNDELRTALEQHLGETRGHVARLEQILAQVGASAGGKSCEGMAGLIREGQQLLNEPADPVVRDAALIAAAQRVEH